MAEVHLYEGTAPSTTPTTTSNLSSAQVSDYMTTNLITVSPDTGIEAAVDILVKYKISGLPVVDESGELVGMLSEKDCLSVFINTLHQDGQMGEVVDFMSDKVSTVEADMSLVLLAEKFVKQHYKRFPVLNKEGALVGQISRADVLRAVDLLT